jgi:hypothetical protein
MQLQKNGRELSSEKNRIGVQRREEWIQNIENQLPWIDQPKTESKNESSLYN